MKLIVEKYDTVFPNNSLDTFKKINVDKNIITELKIRNFIYEKPNILTK
ncbi:hypothetical protein VN93_0495 [Lactococcus cremoris]|uniref:Uncharacterized protein n=1 Tax=Lactococcus lactis subsp. cremoris TaxID=1359 RepID=A0ABR5EJ08_LACLC|nr:hypothetical protein VN93_0495 [Lactococcus cremoris]